MHRGPPAPRDDGGPGCIADPEYRTEFIGVLRGTTNLGDETVHGVGAQARRVPLHRRRRLVWMFDEHEVVVGKKPPALAVIIARILVPHQEDLPVRQHGYIRHELVHCTVHGDLPRYQSAPYARSKRSIR